MGRRLKSIEEVFDEIKLNISRRGKKPFVKYPLSSFDILIWDTSGLIDIIHSYRNNNVRNGACPSSLSDFLKNSTKIPLPFNVTTPHVTIEVDKHAQVKINDHVLEIPSEVRDFFTTYYGSFLDLNSYLESQGWEKEMCSYFVYLLSPHICSDCPKKYEEGLSLTDRQILSYFLNYSLKKRTRSIGVVTSDRHISEGVKLMRDIFSGRYVSEGGFLQFFISQDRTDSWEEDFNEVAEKMYVVSTRRKNGRKTYYW